MQTWEIRLWKCSRCSKVNAVRGNMLKHVNSRECHGSHLIELRGTVTVDLQNEVHIDSTSSSAQQQPAMPVKDRVPAFSESGDDARIDWLFEAGGTLIKTILRSPVCNIPALMYESLWGEEAPDHFQSILSSPRGLLVVGDRGTVELKPPLNKAFVKSLASHILELLESVCTYSIPHRRPDLQPLATQCLHSLHQTFPREDKTLLTAIARPLTGLTSEPLKAMIKEVVNQLHGSCLSKMPKNKHYLT